MPGMGMSPATGHGAAAEFLGMWLAMMVPMMLPSLAPTLSRCRRTPAGGGRLGRHGLTALVLVGYFTVWAALGAAVHAAAEGLAELAPRRGAVTGPVLLLAAAVQFTSWKARWLARCRHEAARVLPRTALGAWRHGLGLGVRCSLSCGNLMLALLAIGMMDPAAMAAVTLAVTAERLAPAPRLATRAAGAAIAAAGVLTLASR